MSPDEWGRLADWKDLLSAIPTPLDIRKVRLWLVSICRLTPEKTEPEVINCLSVIERFVDRDATNDEFEIALGQAFYAAYASMFEDQTAFLASLANDPRLEIKPVELVDYSVARLIEPPSLLAASLLRDIFGNPFRSFTFSADWRSDTAVSLAKHIYESRDFSGMPILADALQDAGCDNDDLLNHCRDVEQVHVRGCWVVDHVLGKG